MTTTIPTTMPIATDNDDYDNTINNNNTYSNRLQWQQQQQQQERYPMQLTCLLIILHTVVKLEALKRLIVSCAWLVWNKLSCGSDTQQQCDTSLEYHSCTNKQLSKTNSRKTSISSSFIVNKIRKRVPGNQSSDC